jgi:hypothetical protein
MPKHRCLIHRVSGSGQCLDLAVAAAAVHSACGSRLVLVFALLSLS